MSDIPCKAVLLEMTLLHFYLSENIIITCSLLNDNIARNRILSGCFSFSVDTKYFTLVTFWMGSDEKSSVIFTPIPL